MDSAVFVFVCSICGGASEKICVYCTKDACANHLCERCAKCSDCCTCDVRIGDSTSHHHHSNGSALNNGNNGHVAHQIVEQPE